MNPLSRIFSFPGFGADRPPAPENHGDRVPLPPWDMYTVAVALFSGYILFPLLVSNFMKLTYPFIEPAYKMFVEQGMVLLSWGIIFLFLHLKYGSLRLYLGITLPRPKRYYVWETLMLLLLTIALTLLSSWFWIALQQQHPNWQFGANNPYGNYSSTQFLVLSLFAILMAPFLEELIFRGFVQATFYKISTPVRTIIFTCLTFLLLHTNYFENIRALVHVLLLGLCFGIWRERTQSLVPGMIAHLCNNVVATAIMLHSVKGG